MEIDGGACANVWTGVGNGAWMRQEKSPLPKEGATGCEDKSEDKNKDKAKKPVRRGAGTAVPCPYNGRNGRARRPAPGVRR